MTDGHPAMTPDQNAELWALTAKLGRETRWMEFAAQDDPDHAWKGSQARRLRQKYEAVLAVFKQHNLFLGG